MVKLNLNDGTTNYDIEGKAVIAIVVEPAGHDADTAVLLVGKSSVRKVALAAGSGVGVIINRLGDNIFERVTLAEKAIDQIKGVVGGGVIKEQEIFEGKMKDFLDEGY